MSRQVLIIGATSAIAEEVARIYAARGATLSLLARDGERLEALVGDLRVRGAAQVRATRFDAANRASCDGALREVLAGSGTFEVALIAHGTLPDQAACDADVARTLEEFQVNGLSVLGMLVPLAEYFEQAGRGTIAVIGSVAGDRGRLPNYLYGAAKAAVHTYLQGLRARMYRCGVQVLTVKPGRVETPMTAGMESGIPAISARAAAERIVHAIDTGKEVVYLPSWWRLVMWLLRLLPERLFKRFSF